MAKRAFKPKGTWREKVEKEQEVKIVDIPPAWEGKMGPGKMVIASPGIIDKLVKYIPCGKVSTIPVLREKLAAGYGTATACPLTTGLFLRIVAEAAEEDRAGGRKQVTPYWRVLKEQGYLNEKFPGGIALQKAYLEQEGWHVIPGRKKGSLVVEDYSGHIFHF